MIKIRTAITLLKEAHRISKGTDMAKLRRYQRAAETHIQTLTDDEARAVLRVVDSLKIPTPMNLAFNYQTQKWRL